MDAYLEAPADARPMFLHVGDEVALVNRGGWGVEEWQVVSHDERTAFLFRAETENAMGDELRRPRPTFTFAKLTLLYRPDAAWSAHDRKLEDWRATRPAPR